MSCSTDNADMGDTMALDSSIRTVELTTQVRVERVDISDCFRIYGGMRGPGKGTLDPITVILRDFGGSGQIIVECWGSAWAAWYGAIGSETLRQHLAGCDPLSVADRMVNAADSNGSATRKHARGWLNDIVTTAINVIRVEVAAAAKQRVGATA